MPGCIGYLPAAPGDIFSESEVFQRLTDVYNQLDHPQAPSYNLEKDKEEKIILDLVSDDEQN